jgi:hypothetical protein
VPVRTRWIFAAGSAALGLVWIGQGLGFIGGSGFMVDDYRWAIAGGLLLLGGVVLGLSALRGRPQA